METEHYIKYILNSIILLITMKNPTTIKTDFANINFCSLNKIHVVYYGYCVNKVINCSLHKLQNCT